jgi:hypothetical protein
MFQQNREEEERKRKKLKVQNVKYINTMGTILKTMLLEV